MLEKRVTKGPVHSNGWGYGQREHIESGKDIDELEFGGLVHSMHNLSASSQPRFITTNSVTSYNLCISCVGKRPSNTTTFGLLSSLSHIINFTWIAAAHIRLAQEVLDFAQLWYTRGILCLQELYAINYILVWKWLTLWQHALQTYTRCLWRLWSITP